MAHPFLSDEWIAAAEAIRDRYAREGLIAPPPVRMNLVVTDVPHGESPVNAYLDTATEGFVLEKGVLEAPDVTVTTDYETAKNLFVGQDTQSAMQAFMAGRVKVQGDLTKLMALFAAAPDVARHGIAAELKEMTA